MARHLGFGNPEWYPAPITSNGSGADLAQWSYCWLVTKKFPLFWGPRGYSGKCLSWPGTKSLIPGAGEFCRWLGESEWQSIWIPPQPLKAITAPACRGPQNTWPPWCSQLTWVYCWRQAIKRSMTIPYVCSERSSSSQGRKMKFISQLYLSSYTFWWLAGIGFVERGLSQFLCFVVCHWYIDSLLVLKTSFIVRKSIPMWHF